MTSHPIFKRDTKENETIWQLPVIEILAAGVMPILSIYWPKKAITIDLPYYTSDRAFFDMFITGYARAFDIVAIANGIKADTN